MNDGKKNALCAGWFGKKGRFFLSGVDVKGTEKQKRRGLRERMEGRAGCDWRELKA